MTFVRRMILPATVLLVAGACGGHPHRAVRHTTMARARPTAAAEAAKAAAAMPKEAEYVYSPIGKRDPFRSPFADLHPTEVRHEGGRPLTKLQRWNLEQLTLRATITGTSSPRAMVVDPDGNGYVVRRGTLIGKNWGKVTAIKRDCIVITEQVRDATQAVVAVKQTKCLPKSKDELNLEKQFD